MSLLRCAVTGFRVCLVCASAVQLWPQAASVRGKITDATTNSPIPGVDVVLTGTPRTSAAKDCRTGQPVPNKTLSDAQGKYCISGLVAGETIEISYSRADYTPNPRKAKVVLSPADYQVQEVYLQPNTIDSASWGKWADKVITAGNTETPEAYERIWRSLGNMGVSPEGQIEAARQLTRRSPQANRSLVLKNFAEVKQEELTRTEENINATIGGSAKLSRQGVVPGDVAAAVAAYSLKTQPLTGTYKIDFQRDFAETWGSDAGSKLTALASHDQPSVDDLEILNTIGKAKAQGTMIAPR